MPFDSLLNCVQENLEASLMTAPERLLLYSLVLSLRPSNCLEIGFYKGGSAYVILSALQDLAAAGSGTNGGGKLVSIDIWHPNLPELPGCAFDAGSYPNFYFVHGSSSDPAVLETAFLLLGGGIDFCLIDGDHSYDAVLADSNNVLRHMNRGGVILFHDCHDASVMRAIDEFLRMASQVVDCGDLTSTGDESRSSHKEWGGVRMVRVI